MNLSPYALIRLRQNSRIVAAYHAARRRAHDLVPLPAGPLPENPLRARPETRF